MTNLQLPQLSGKLFLTDGGIETTLIFHEGYELPHFAAFTLLDTKQGYEAIKRYYEPYTALAVSAHTGFVLESPTWRANSDWGWKGGYDDEALDRVNGKAVELLRELKHEYEMPESPFIVSGCIGPRGDGYQVDQAMSAQEAQEYHSRQIASFAASGADMVSAITMTYVEEAIGIARAAHAVGMPVVISFTTETDGTLPSGMSLKDAIEAVDAATDNAPAYYMINCAHPDHFRDALESGAPWAARIKGIRANASRLSHAELDEAESLDCGGPEELGKIYQDLRRAFPAFNVLGGCCGTDHRHIGEISKCCVH